MSYAKNWAFTMFPEDTKPEFAFGNIPFVIYAIAGRETCPDTGRKHLQCYVQFYNRRHFPWVKQWFPGAHLEVAHSSPAINIAYCSKENDFYEFGARPTAGQGKRNDLAEMCDKVKEGLSTAETAEQFGTLCVKYSRGISDYKRMLYRPVSRDVTVTCLWGDAGTGKTKWAFDKFGYENVYTVNPSHSKALWFDGYTDQKCLLIDDFNGWIDFRVFLKLLDRYPFLCPIKGSSIWAQWTDIVITSEAAPEYWYSQSAGNFAQILRRISQVFHLTKQIEDSPSSSNPCPPPPNAISQADIYQIPSRT